MSNNQFTSAALEELKNNTLLLTTANEHLTDEIFLTKIGNNISRAVEVLERDISALKKEYPGKFVYDVDTGSILEKIDGAAQRMLKPGKEVKDNHASGALGREMEAYISSIRKAIEEIRQKVQGTHAAKAGKGPGVDVMGSFGSIFQSVGGLFLFSLKVLACIVVLGGVIFTYLYFTMEKDTIYLNETRIISSVIKEKKDKVTGLEKELQGLQEERDAMKDNTSEMSREEKVAALDLEMEIKETNDELNQLAAEISVQENKLSNNQEKLDRFRNKSFLERLLKQ